LESDAALAYDKGSIVLLSDADSPNFSTRQAYEKAILAEVEETDPFLDVEESYKDVVKKVEVYLSNIYAGEKKTYDMEIEDDEGGSDEYSDEDSCDEEMEEKKKRQSTSIYTGVYYKKDRKSWTSSIKHGGKQQGLGSYTVETDAAMAFDEAAKIMRGAAAEINFATLKGYEKAKKHELEKTGFGSDASMSYTSIKAKVAEVVWKTCPTATVDAGSSKRESVKQQKNIAPKKKASIYTGVYYHKPTKKWISQIYDSTNIHLGRYKVQADAALAFDEAVKQLKGPTAETNFSSLEDYEKAKKQELRETGLGSDAALSSASIISKISDIVSKHRLNTKTKPVGAENQQEDIAPKKKSSEYTGFTYLRDRNKWLSQITHDRGKVNLGYYNLQADAALAFDEAVKQLRGLDAKTNFSSLEDYEKAKKDELEKTALSSDVAKSSAVIKAKVTDIVRKTWPTASIHDSGSNKREKVNVEKQQAVTPKKKTSNYVGVSYHKSKKKWVSQITHNNGTIKLGYFKLQADAAFAFDEAVKQLRGSTAKTNFSSLEDYEIAKKQEFKETGLSSAAAKSSAAIISKISDIVSKHRLNSTTKPTGNKTSPAHQQSKHSDYIGVTYNNSTQAFEADIKHGRRKHHVGHWHLQSDAALAYDEAFKLLNGEDCSSVNFASDQSYLDARSNEISKLFGSSVTIEPISSITTEIKRQLSKIPSPELDALNDAMAAKWSRYLPSVTGNDFMALYQQSMGKLLGMTTTQQSEQQSTSTSIVSDNAVTECAKDTEVPEGGFKPISDSGPKDMKSSQPQPEVQDESDDEASLFSGGDMEEEEETTDAVVNTSDKVKAGAQSVLNDNTSSSAIKRKESDLIKELPIGCPVMWNMNDDSFNCGTVSSKPTKGKQYEVVDKEKSNSKLVPGESLSFGIDCPVYVASSCEDKSPLLQGKVLTYTNKSYTILINKEGNQIQVMTGVTQDRVSFRRVEEEVESSAAQPYNIAVASELNDNIQKKTPPSQQPQVEKPRYDNDNSTITSLDSAQASSRRQLATGSIPRKQGDSVDCRIYFPHWLIPDTASRQRLFCEYPTSVVYRSL